MKSRKTLWAWNICSIFVGNWNHVIRLTTFVRRYVMYKHQITERYQCNCCLGQAAGYGITIISGQKTRYENSKYDFCYLQRMLFGLLGYSLWSMSARDQFFICHCLAVDTCHSAWRLNLWERRWKDFVLDKLQGTRQPGWINWEYLKMLTLIRACSPHLDLVDAGPLVVVGKHAFHRRDGCSSPSELLRYPAEFIRWKCSKKSKLCFWTWNVMIENSLEVELLSKDGLAALGGTLGDCLRIVQNISIQVIASNVEYLFFKHFTRFVCFLQRCLQNIFVKITSLLYPPSRPYTMGTLPSKRLRRAFNNYNLYILMNTQ